MTKRGRFVPCSVFKKNSGLQDTQLFVDSHIPIKSPSMFCKGQFFRCLDLKTETSHLTKGESRILQRLICPSPADRKAQEKENLAPCASERRNRVREDDFRDGGNAGGRLVWQVAGLPLKEQVREPTYGTCRDPTGPSRTIHHVLISYHYGLLLELKGQKF